MYKGVHIAPKSFLACAGCSQCIAHCIAVTWCDVSVIAWGSVMFQQCSGQCIAGTCWERFWRDAHTLKNDTIVVLLIIASFIFYVSCLFHYSPLMYCSDYFLKIFFCFKHECEKCMWVLLVVLFCQRGFFMSFNCVWASLNFLNLIPDFVVLCTAWAIHCVL